MLTNNWSEVGGGKSDPSHIPGPNGGASVEYITNTIA